MDLTRLRAFAVTAEAGSITAASRELHLTQPALSRQLAALERQVGQPLLRRRADGVVLTQYGRRFLDDVLAVLAVYDAAFGVVGGRRRGASGGGPSAPGPPPSVVVGMSMSIGRNLLTAARRRLAAGHADATLESKQVAFGREPVDLVSGRLDIALAWLPVHATTAVTATPLLDEPRGVALPADHHLAALDEVPMEALLDEPFLALPEWTGPLRAFWLAEDQRGGRAPRIGAVVRGPEETMEALAQGVGVALTTTGNAALYRRPEFVVRPVPGLPPAILAALTRRGEGRALVLEVLDALQQEASGTSGGHPAQAPRGPD